MKIQTHSPHTGAFEKVEVEDVEYIQLPPGAVLVYKRKDGKEEFFKAEGHNLTLVVEK